MECCIVKKEITKYRLAVWILLQQYHEFCPYFLRKTLMKQTPLPLQQIKGGPSFASCVNRCRPHAQNNFHCFNSGYRIRPKLQPEFTSPPSIIPTAPANLILLQQTIQSPSHHLLSFRHAFFWCLNLNLNLNLKSNHSVSWQAKMLLLCEVPSHLSSVYRCFFFLHVVRTSAWI